MARIYADEHVPVRIVYALRRLGHDVITVRETSLSKSGDAIPDDLILQFAAQQQRIVLTFNEDDVRQLHEQNARHCGIICCNEPAEEAEKKIARRIDAFLKANNMNSRIERLTL